MAQLLPARRSSLGRANCCPAALLTEITKELPAADLDSASSQLRECAGAFDELRLSMARFYLWYAAAWSPLSRICLAGRLTAPQL